MTSLYIDKITRDKTLIVNNNDDYMLIRYIDEGKTINLYLYLEYKDIYDKLEKLRNHLPKKVYNYFINKYFPLFNFKDDILIKL